MTPSKLLNSCRVTGGNGGSTGKLAGQKKETLPSTIGEAKGGGMIIVLDNLTQQELGRFSTLEEAVESAAYADAAEPTLVGVGTKGGRKSAKTKTPARLIAEQEKEDRAAEAVAAAFHASKEASMRRFGRMFSAAGEAVVMVRTSRTTESRFSSLSGYSAGGDEHAVTESLVTESGRTVIDGEWLACIGADGDLCERKVRAGYPEVARSATADWMPSSLAGEIYSSDRHAASAWQEAEIAAARAKKAAKKAAAQAAMSPLPIPQPKGLAGLASILKGVQ